MGPRGGIAGEEGAADGHVYAALDLGTNNCRLLIARPTHAGFRVIDSFSRIVRLGEGLGANGRLGEPAVDRAIAALKVCAGKIKRRGVTRSRHVATEACRRATNCDDFLTKVSVETGLAFEIISAEEEAALAMAGCEPLIEDGTSHVLVFDIGGGSTEVAWVEVDAEPRILDSLSLPCGVVDMSERYDGRDVSPDVYRAMIGEVAARLAPFEARHSIRARVAGGGVQMIGTSGTVTTLMGMLLDLPRYDRARVDGTRLEFDAMWAVADRLLGMDYDTRAAHPCILGARAEFVIPGTAILAAICETWPVGRVTVADRGLREGILLHLMAEQR
ncbi:MAG: Ppx/GppA phosphatase family protein [Alphaproteobacteria bacterium]|nr:Ppx/GppA phosphatase family protein [Alphaproteobacteria bacterium]